MEIPKQIGPYEILSKIGSGGMADVYEAMDAKLERRVALKVLPKKYTEDEDRSQRFQREILATAKLTHPNIVTVFDAGFDGEFNYYTMSLLTGGHLKAKIQSGLTHCEIITICKQVASALGHAHANNFVHRDVKPENILFDTHGNALLTDLGITKLVGSSMTGTGLSIGTPYYMSPEQARGQTIDGRADLYSLGVVLYRMLTKTHLFDAEESLGICMKHIQEPPLPLPKEHQRFQPILDKLLAKDPDDRYQVADELILSLNAMEATMEKEPQPAEPEEQVTLKQEHAPSATSSAEIRTQKKTPWIAFGVAALIAIFVGSSIFFFKSTNPHTTTPVAPKPSSNTGLAIFILDSEPTGAFVFHNDKSIGQTPLSIETLPGGDHTFTLRKRFYRDKTIKQTLVEKKITNSHFTLEKGTGSLSILSEPSGAEIWLDGNKQNIQTPSTLEGLSAGKHKLELRKDDAYLYQDVEIDTDDTTILRASLKAAELVNYQGEWQTLKELSALAKQRDDKKQTISPEGSNALEIYRVILQHEPNNTAALDAINGYFDQANKRIDALMAAKEWDKALTHAELTSTLFKRYTGLETLRKKVLALRSTEEAANRVASYKVQQAKIEKLISLQHLYEAQIALDALVKDFANGDKNDDLAKSITHAKREFHKNIETLTGELALLDLSTSKLTGYIQVSKTEITVKQWNACYRDSACKNMPVALNEASAQHPVSGVSFTEIQYEFLPWLKQKTGINFRLPTQHEWKHAYSQNETHYYWGNSANQSYANGAERFGWPNDGSEESAPVGRYKANQHGLFDMAGNVWEWTSSCEKRANAENCNRRMILGGSWFSATKFLNGKEPLAENQNSTAKDRGFRVVRDYHWTEEP